MAARFFAGYAHGQPVIGVLADTKAEAVGFLADTYGDLAVSLIAEAEDELFRRLEGYTPPRPQPSAAPAADVPSSPDVAEGTPTPAAPADPPAEADEAAVDGGSEGADARPAGGDVAVNECAVCGAKDVPEGRAEVSLDEYGEIRCKKCSG